MLENAQRKCIADTEVIVISLTLTTFVTAESVETLTAEYDTQTMHIICQKQ